MKVPFTLRDGSHFEIAGGSITGTSHIKNFRNNQDAFTWDWVEVDNPAFVAVIADGCTNKGYGASEVGANLAVEAITLSLLSKLKDNPFSLHPAGTKFWGQIQKINEQVLKKHTNYMGRTLISAIKKYALYTINGVMITKDLVIFFSIGDGVYALNGEVKTFGEEYQNKPPYLAYNLIKNQVSFSKKELGFSLNKYVVLDTVSGKEPDQFDSFMIGSDGVIDLIKAKDALIPGTNNPVGEISQFWTDDQYFDQKFALQTKLKLINRETQKPILDKMDGEPYARIEKSPGLLPDDTTIIVGRKIKSDTKPSKL